jgi:O-antigen/teichoic acid export membrane protein
MAGTQNAIFSVIMPHSAVLHAQQNSEDLGKLLVRATEFGVILLLLTGLPLVVFAAPLIRIWIGVQFQDSGGEILTILVVANILRLIGAPYASILIGTGRQRLVTVSPLLEGGSNLIASVVLGIRYGAIGVAEGTLIGAVIGLLGHVFYNIPRTRNEISVSPQHFILSCIGVPALACSPLAVLAVRTWKGFGPSMPLFASVLSVTLLLSAGIVFYARGGQHSSTD